MKIVRSSESKRIFTAGKPRTNRIKKLLNQFFNAIIYGMKTRLWITVCITIIFLTGCMSENGLVFVKNTGDTIDIQAYYYLAIGEGSSGEIKIIENLSQKEMDLNFLGVKKEFTTDPEGYNSLTISLADLDRQFFDTLTEYLQDPDIYRNELFKDTDEITGNPFIFCLTTQIEKDKIVIPMPIHIMNIIDDAPLHIMIIIENDTYYWRFADENHNIRYQVYLEKDIKDVDKQDFKDNLTHIIHDISDRPYIKSYNQVDRTISGYKFTTDTGSVLIDGKKAGVLYWGTSEIELAENEEVLKDIVVTTVKGDSNHYYINPDALKDTEEVTVDTYEVSDIKSTEEVYYDTYETYSSEYIDNDTEEIEVGSPEISTHEIDIENFSENTEETTGDSNEVTEETVEPEVSQYTISDEVQYYERFTEDTDENEVATAEVRTNDFAFGTDTDSIDIAEPSYSPSTFEVVFTLDDTDEIGFIYECDTNEIEMIHYYAEDTSEIKVREKLSDHDIFYNGKKIYIKTGTEYKDITLHTPEFYYIRTEEREFILYIEPIRNNKWDLQEKAVNGEL